MKPYKMWRCQELTNQDRDQRKEFCRWFMEEDIDPQLIFFSDEKWFARLVRTSVTGVSVILIRLKNATTKVRKKSCAALQSSMEQTFPFTDFKMIISHPQQLTVKDIGQCWKT